MKRSLLAFTLSILCAASIAGPREAGGGADAGVQRLLRQLTAERDQLQVENQTLSKELEAKEKELNKVSKKLDGKENSLGKYKDVNGKLVDRLKLAQEKIIEMNQAYSSLQKEHADLQGLSADQKATIAQQGEEIKQHVSNNLRMLEINSELLGKYENKGFFTLLVNREPITQLHKVAVENLIQEYQFELEDLSADESLLQEGSPLQEESLASHE